MCGVNFHAANSYIAKLVAKDMKLLFVNRLKIKEAKGIVRREVAGCTPGTIDMVGPQMRRQFIFNLCIYYLKD